MQEVINTNLPMQLVQQGGFLAVLVTVLYFYRRDYKSLMYDRKLAIEKLLSIVEKATDAINRNQDINERVAEYMEEMRNRRRVYDSIGRRNETT